MDGSRPAPDRIAISEQIADDLGAGSGERITVATPTSEAALRARLIG